MHDPYIPLEQRFGEAIKRSESLARYTVARLGGPADALFVAHTITDLADVVMLAHENQIPWIMLGGGTNVLISDAGYRGLVIINHAKTVMIEDDGRVVAESGANLSTLARHCMARGLAGLEWAVNVPGTVGGATVNNAGAHGSDMAHSVCLVDLLSLEEQPHTEQWPLERMSYAYRASALKGYRGRYVVLSTTLQLQPGHDPDELHARASEYIAHRKRTQPPGASLGSMFKNPPGDYAGRLIEAAGLKGTTVGGVQISPIHANFFVNVGGGTSRDYLALINLARDTVQEKFGVTLELEIELIGG